VLFYKTEHFDKINIIAETSLIFSLSVRTIYLNSVIAVVNDKCGSLQEMNET